MSMRITAILVALALALVVWPSAMQAQEKERVVDVRQAEALEARAAALATDLRTFERAAKLLRKAAELRPPGDVVALEDRITAARLLFYRRDIENAYTLMVRAAEDASMIGEVFTSAYAFVDAAHIAITRGDGSAAQDHLYRARLLSLSPHLTDVQHTSLENRLGSVGALVASKDQQR